MEIARDCITTRKEDDGHQQAQQARAQQIIEGITRQTGLKERTQFKATLNLLSRCDPVLGRRDSTVILSDSFGLKASGGLSDVVCISADGTVVTDSRRDRMDELLHAAEAFAANARLRKMVDYLLEYYDDPAKKLAPLFDVIERAKTAFGSLHDAADALSISSRKLDRVKGIIHDETIRSSRHPGRALGAQRDPTPAESQLCEDVAEQIVSAYRNLVQNGTAPM